MSQQSPDERKTHPPPLHPSSPHTVIRNPQRRPLPIPIGSRIATGSRYGFDFTNDSVTPYRCPLRGKSYILLEPEFKPFALRHPRLLQWLARKHVETKREIDELGDLFPRGEAGTFIARQRMLTFKAILEGFALDRAFNSEVMTRKYIERCIPLLTRSVLELNR